MNETKTTVITARVDARKKQNKAVFLARILASTRRDKHSCPAAAAGIYCPFTGKCFCDYITPVHWYAYTSKKAN